MTPNSFIPAGMVTGIGPVPTTDALDAVSFIAQHSPELPFSPTLTTRGRIHLVHHLVNEALGGLIASLGSREPDAPGYRVREGHMGDCLAWLNDPAPALDRRAGEGLAAFEDALRQQQFPRAAAIKGHIVGPVTLAMSLFRGPGRGRSFADHARLRRLVRRYVVRLARGQVRRLRRFGLPVLLFVHEPALALAAQAGDASSTRTIGEALEPVLDAITVEGGHSTLDGGDAGAASMLSCLQPHSIAMPLDETLSEHLRQPPLRRFVAHGGALAFGAEPRRLTRVGGVREHFHHWLGSAAQCCDIQQVACQSFVAVGHAWPANDLASTICHFNAANHLASLVRRVAWGDDKSGLGKMRSFEKSPSCRGRAPG